MPSTHHRPECIAIVVCNEIIEDKRTNNKSLIGLFNGIVVPSIPASHGRLFILASVTDGRGEHELQIRVETPSGLKLFEATAKVKFMSPLIVHDLVIEVMGLPLPEEGEYYIGIYCEAERLGSRRFTVFRRKER